MTDHLISDADTWPAITREPQRLDEVLAWLRANNIDPYDVPTDATVAVTTTEPEGAPAIRYEVYLRDASGKHYPADLSNPNTGPAREERTTPLVVPPPAHWWIEPEPAS